MLEVCDCNKNVSLKEHGLEICEKTHSKVKHLSEGGGMGVVGIVRSS